MGGPSHRLNFINNKIGNGGFNDFMELLGGEGLAHFLLFA